MGTRQSKHGAVLSSPPQSSTKVTTDKHTPTVAAVSSLSPVKRIAQQSSTLASLTDNVPTPNVVKPFQANPTVTLSGDAAAVGDPAVVIAPKKLKNDFHVHKENLVFGSLSDEPAQFWRFYESILDMSKADIEWLGKLRTNPEAIELYNGQVTPGHVSILLLDTATMEMWPALVGPSHMDIEYVAISHVWPMHSKMTLFGMKNEPADSQRLQDLLAVCSQVSKVYGIRHIWFDVLSTVQDSPTEIKAATELMGYVYKYASLTVVLFTQVSDWSGERAWPLRRWTFQEQVLSRKLVPAYPHSLGIRCNSSKKGNITVWVKNSTSFIEINRKPVTSLYSALQESASRFGGWPLDEFYSVAHAVGIGHLVQFHYDLSVQQVFQMFVKCAASIGDFSMTSNKYTSAVLGFTLYIKEELAFADLSKFDILHHGIRLIPGGLEVACIIKTLAMTSSVAEYLKWESKTLYQIRANLNSVAGFSNDHMSLFNAFKSFVIDVLKSQEEWASPLKDRVTSTCDLKLRQESDDWEYFCEFGVHFLAWLAENCEGFGLLLDSGGYVYLGPLEQIAGLHVGKSMEQSYIVWKGRLDGMLKLRPVGNDKGIVTNLFLLGAILDEHNDLICESHLVLP